MTSDCTGMDRREFLQSAAGGLVAALLAQSPAEASQRRGMTTRGVVIVPEDLTLTEWPDLAKQAGLSTIALHHGSSPAVVLKAVQSDRGQKFLERCRRLGLQVEYELHAMGELLPRNLFGKDKTMFRMDERGDRVAGGNLCVTSPRAMEIVAENARRLARELKPTTGRYFLWGDDGVPWCRCQKCRELSDSDQALLVAGRILSALRPQDPRATVAPLAYSTTMTPPRKIKPPPGVFLEYAPINRRYDVPLAKLTAAADKDGLQELDANLAVFPADTAQVLEYWLDVSKASNWQRPSKALAWRKDVFLSDVQTYRARGIRHITSFAAWLDADYVKRYGRPDFLNEYGAGLSRA
jgi:hypothetical protein